MTPKPIVIYHANCADGFTAAWCFHHENDSAYDFHPGVYSEAPPDVTGRDVYLVDFSYKRAAVEAMLKTANSVTLIDHHISALRDLDGLPGLRTYCDVSRSGAGLAWDFLFGRASDGIADIGDTQDLPNDPMPRPASYTLAPPPLLLAVQDRDLWKFELQGTKPLCEYLFSHDQTFSNWTRLMKESLDPVGLYEQNMIGDTMLRAWTKSVATLVDATTRWTHIDNHWVPVCNLPHIYASDAGHLLLERHPGAAFAATYYDKPSANSWERVRVFSLRGRKDGLDVSQLAAREGGGGHAAAAGFTVPHFHVLAGI